MIIFVSDAFSEQYRGGGELTTDAIIAASLFPVNKVLSRDVSLELMEEYKKAYWIFGNFSGLDSPRLMYAIKNLNYSVIEYDYKYCKFRSSKKHIAAEGKCDCSSSYAGKLVASFLGKSDRVFWMSNGQKETYEAIYPFLKKKSFVLSSVFTDETLQWITSLNTNKKNNKWVILNSPSWIKGTEDSITFAKENNLEYELVWGLEYHDLLKKLAESKGLIFQPKGLDTCPRLTIEAKLLDCELILNNNVQHKDEPWFIEKSKIIPYLKSRPIVFWEEITLKAHKNLNISLVKDQKDNNFKIIVPFYNAERWLSKCINSLKLQKNTNFECYLIDDMSTDKSATEVKKHIKGDDRFVLIENKTKRFALGNIVNAIEHCECKDENIIVLLDGDDWLASSYTLDTLSKTYKEKGCLMTYGSYVYNPTGTRGVEPSEYSAEVIKNNAFREDEWRASHLRSFKFSLWKKLDHNDLKDEDGHYYKMAYDQAIMLPLLEMASDRSCYIKDSLYVYNKDNPISVDKIKQLEQYSTAQAIRRKKKYTKIA